MKAYALREERFVTDAAGKRVGVLLELKAYERLREAEEELEDIRAYDAARPRAAAEIASGRFVALAQYRAARSRKRK